MEGETVNSIVFTHTKVESDGTLFKLLNYP